MGLDNLYGLGSLRPGVCTSTSRPGSPFEGQLIYETDTDLVQGWNGSGWKSLGNLKASTNGSVLQVVSTTKTDTLSASLSAATGTAITGLTASITPSSTNNKILVMVQTNGGISDGNVVYNGFQITRAGTAIGLGDADGNRSRYTAVGRVNANNTYDAITTTMVFLDSPATTSSTTYGVTVFNATGGTRTIYVNRASYDGNDTDGIRVISTITVMEISG